jgi:hypothetical protein
MISIRSQIRLTAASVFLFALGSFAVAPYAWAHETSETPESVDEMLTSDPAKHAEHGLGEIGAKLANPVSSIWSLSFNFQTPFSDGDVNSGDPEVGANVIFQPVLPIPLYGREDQDEMWRMITRPIIPIVFTTPIPESFNNFKRRGGIGDIQLPLLLVPPPKLLGAPDNLIFGLGPNWLFPTSTNDNLGNQQWGVGPAVVLGWKTKFLTTVLFPSFAFHIGDRGDRKSGTRDISQMSLLYTLIFNLPDAWQVGTNPTISYNDKAKSGDKWNVPIGLFGAKTTKIGGIPFNIKVGVEYSVVSQDTFGKRANFRIQITPVVPSLIQRPIFGGDLPPK